MQTIVSVDAIERIIRQTVKESVCEAIGVEMMKLHAELLSYVSDKEQKEIERFYRKPQKKVAKRIEVKM